MAAQAWQAEGSPEPTKRSKVRTDSTKLSSDLKTPHTHALKKKITQLLPFCQASRLERNEIKLHCVLEPCVSCCCLSQFARSLERSWSCAEICSLLASLPCPPPSPPNPAPVRPFLPFLALPSLSHSFFLSLFSSSCLSRFLFLSLAFSLPFSLFLFHTLSLPIDYLLPPLSPPFTLHFSLLPSFENSRPCIHSRAVAASSPGLFPHPPP